METELPQKRIRNIMRCTFETNNITKETLYLVTKTTEMFIKHFSRESYNYGNKPNLLEYKHLADLVQNNDSLGYLQQILPRKIKVKEFRALLEQENGTSDSASETD